MRQTARLDPDDSTEPNGTWQRKHLATLLTNSQPLSLASIIFGMAVCDYGSPIIGARNQVLIPPPVQANPSNLTSQGNQFSNGIAINLPNPDNPSAVHQTMRALGLSNYTHISLSPEGIKRIAVEEDQRRHDEFRKNCWLFYLILVNTPLPVLFYDALHLGF